MEKFEYIVDLTSKVSLPTLSIFLIVIALWVVLRIRTRVISFKPNIELLEYRLSDIQKTIKGEKRKVADTIEEKKTSFLNIPNISFHYADKKQIENFYNDYFREPTVESLVSEIASEVAGDVKGKVPQFIEAKVGGKDLSKWISTIKLPETSLNGMFLRYQRETIKKNQVTLGLDVVDVELSELLEFQKLINDLEERFGAKLNEITLNEREAVIKEKAAEKTLVKLENASGPILIEGQFKISEAENEYYKCSYRHPVSEYILESQKIVTISFLLLKTNIEPHVAGNYTQSVGQSIPLRVYGNVWQPIRREADIWDLKLTPLAVY